MADVKISALPASTTPLAGTEVLPIVQGTTTKQVSVANLTAGRAASASSLSLTNDSNITNILDVLATPTASNTSGIRVWNNTQSGLLWLSGSAYSYAGVGANEVWLYASNTSLNVGPDSATGSLKFTTNGAERARVFPSGGVSIGNTTDPGAGNLSVTGGITAATVKSAATLNVTIAASTPTTLFTSVTGLYQVYAYVAFSGAADLFTASAQVMNDGNGARIVANNTSNLLLTLSGLNVQVTQISGGSITIYYTYLRIA